MPCKNFDQSYVGHSETNIRQNVREHQLSVAKQEGKTSLTKHTKKENTIFDLENTKILAGTNYREIRQTTKGIEIVRKGQAEVTDKNEYPKLATAWKLLTDSL